MYSTLLVSDFNGDLHADILSFFNDTTVGVMLGDGTGHFQQPKFNFVQEISPYEFLGADINDDGRLDLISCGIEGRSVNVYLQNQEETFLASLASPIDDYCEGSAHIHLIDLNNDTILDFLLIDDDWHKITVFLGYSNGTFHSSGISTATLASSPARYDLGDVDEDGRMDVLFAMEGPDLYLLSGFGNGSFVNVRNYTSSFQLAAAAIALKDSNDDQHVDMINIAEESSLMSVRFGDGRGGFDTELIYEMEQNYCVKNLFVGDLDGDSKMDVAIICVTKGPSHFYFGAKNGSLVLVNTVELDSSMNSWAMGNFNEDNWLDLITIFTDQAKLTVGCDPGVLINSTTYATGSASRPSMIVTDDFNHDHQWDLALLNAGQDSIAVRFDRADGTFNDGGIYPTGDQSSPQSLVMENFNDDGIADLVVVNGGTDSITLFPGLMNGSFALESTFSTGRGTRPSSVIAAHLNDDQQLDLAVTNDESDTISLFIHSQYPRLEQRKSHQTGTNSRPENLLIAISMVISTWTSLSC